MSILKDTVKKLTRKIIQWEKAFAGFLYDKSMEERSRKKL